MANNKPPKLLPKLNFNPPDEGRGSGDYSYMTDGASYNANPDYAGQFGGNRPNGDTPPAPTAGGIAGGSAREGYAPGDMPIDQLVPWIAEQIQNMNEGFGAANRNPMYFRSQVNSAGNVGRGIPQAPQTGGTPAWMTSSLQYNPQAQQAEQQNWLQQAQQGLGNWLNDVYAGFNNTQNSLFGGGGQSQAPNGAAPNTNTGAGAPNNGGVGDNVLGAGNNPNEPAPMADQQQAARLQDAVTKNQNLTEKAKASGNDKELARLQAEWDRLAPKAAKYGITAERLVNSYMQPGNPAAESSLDRAMGRAIADDTWANAATQAFGRPPNQLEWDEHWRAMNKGGRDPLEGHPQAIQQIQARMQEIEQENQNEAFGQYQQWLANSKV